jgi:hypothetical protein
MCLLACGIFVALLPLPTAITSSWSQHQASVSECMHAERDMLLLLVTDDNDEPIILIWLRLLSAALIAVCDRRPFR